VDARTVTAPDVITAFAVPDLDLASQPCRFFRVRPLQRISPPEPITQPTSVCLTTFASHPFGRRQK